MRKQPNPKAGPPPTNEKGPLETDPIRKSSSNPDPEYSAVIRLASKAFPSWDPETLRYTVQWMIQEAQAATPGGWVQSLVEAFPAPGLISLDFDGQGGILVNPETLLTPKGKELAQALRLVLGHKVHLGQWVAA